MRVLVNEEAEKHLVAKQLIKRSIQPEDIANAVAFLASDGSKDITGQCIQINSGLFML